MSQIMNVPFTYLRSRGNQIDYNLYLYIPVSDGFSIEFQDYIPAPDQDSKSRIQNRIHFIDCKVVPSINNEAKGNFKCFPIMQKTEMEDESIEIRVRVPDPENEYIWFNKTVVFFADADESKPDEPESKQNTDSDLAINAPYTFIGRPSDFFDAIRKEPREFVLHALIPLAGSKLHRQTLTTTEGKKTLKINNARGKIKIKEVSDEFDNRPGTKRLVVKTRRWCIDKPNMPARGSQ